jgi:hypothetical protein
LAFFMVEDDTGTYNATTNPGGYGSPNPVRASLALFVYGYKFMPNPDEDTTLNIINNNDPVNVTSWQVDMNMDGYHYIRVLGFNIWSAVATYQIDNLVFYQTRYYRALAITTNEDPINNPLVWQEELDLTTDEIYANASIYTYQLDTVINSRGKQCYQKAVLKEAQENCNCFGSVPGPVVKPYMQIFVHLNAANFLCRQQKYAQADAELQYLASYCNNINCGC